MMTEQDIWTLIERHEDPSLGRDDKKRIEKQLQDNPELQFRLKTFRKLQSWAKAESLASDAHTHAALHRRLDEEWGIEAVDHEMGRTFPYLAMAALAAACVLAAINLGNMEGSTQSALDAIFGLPQTSVENALLAEL